MKTPLHKQRPFPGEIVEVQSRIGGQPLPSGLNDGDKVRIVSHKQGHWRVAQNGSKFVIETIHIKNVHRYNTCAAPPPIYEAKPNSKPSTKSKPPKSR